MHIFKSYLVLILAILLTGIRANAQASVTEEQNNFLYVDAVQGSDSNAGTQSAPFKTVQAAVTRANVLNQSGMGIRIIVNPGVYRESVTVAGSNLTSAPLTIQAATAGTAIIAGSNVLTGWNEVTSQIYSTSWTENLGQCPVPAGWPTNFAPIALRSEGVYVNGIPLTQVMSYSNLQPGTFFVDDAESTMYVSPATGTDMTTAVVEAAARPKTLSVTGRTNVVIRGLVFRHAANCMNNSGATVSGSTNVLVDSILAEWNNWGGLGVYGSNNITIQNSIASYNGGVGFAGSTDQNVLVSSNESDFNNWRGAQAAFYNWGMGGTKFFEMRSTTVQNHYSYNNQAQGLWFDTDNQNVKITNATLSGNVMAALQIERNEGPISVQNSYLCNSGIGIDVLTSQNLTLQGNTFYNNGQAGTPDEASVYIAGQPGGIYVTDWITGQVYDLFTTNTVLQGNTIVDGSAGQFGFGTYLSGSDWTQFATTLTAGTNTWYDPTTTNSFTLTNGKKTNLLGWQTTVATDYTSTWAAPSATQIANCAAPAASYSDFAVNVDNSSYSLATGQVASTVQVNSFGYGTVNLSVSGVPSGVTASFGQQSMVSGTTALTFISSTAAVAQTVPITVWATSGSRVHSVTFYLQVFPIKPTPTVTWSAPQAIMYGTPLGSAQLNAVLSVNGSCSYTPSAGTVLAAGSNTLTATCTPTDTSTYSSPAPLSVSITVSKAPLTVTAPSFNLPYHSAAPAITPIFSGFVNGDSSASLTTAPSCSTAYSSTSPVGSTPVTSCWGAVSPNYIISYVLGSVTILQASQTISFTPNSSSVTYGVSPITLSASATSGLAVTLTGTAGVCNVSVKTLTVVGAGTCNVTATQVGNSNYLAAPAVLGTIAVNPAPLTITASSPTVVYGAAVPTITPSYSGFVSGNTSASLTSAPVCTTAYTTTSAVGSLPATSCSGANSANYSIAYVPGKVTINKATQTITFATTPSTVTYGVSPLTLSATANSGLPVTLTSTGSCSVSGSTLSVVGVGTCTVTASLAASANYSAATSIVRTISVSKAPLTVTAISLTLAYHSPVPTITPIFSGFVNGDSSASLTTAPSCSTAYYATSAIGSSWVTSCWGAVAANYSLSYVTGTVSVVAAAQTISFNPTVTSVNYGASPLALSATASSSLVVTFAGTPGICSVSGTTLSFTGAGACTITASQPGNANYAPATPVARVITVNPAALTITASSPTVTYAASVPAISAAYAGFVNGDSSASLTTAPTCTTTYTPTSAVGSSPSTGCSGAIGANYSVSYVGGTVSVVAAGQTISFNPAVTSVNYGASPLALSATATSGLAVTFTGTAGICSVSGTTLSIANAGVCTITASQSGNTNYAPATPVTRVINVNPATLTITASSPSVIYGAPVPTITASFAGFVNTDSSASLTAAPTCTTAYTPTSAAGTTPATSCAGAVSSNYLFTYIPGVVTISPAAQTITAFPTLSLAAGAYTGTQSVTISDTTPGAVIYYTTDGTIPTAASTVYTGAISISSTATLNAIALASGCTPSATATATYTITQPTINFSNGFATANGLQLNGKSTLSSTALQLTDGNTYEAASAFFSTPVNITKFSTTFTLQQTAASGDGMMFVIQNASAGAKTLGPTSSSLGYSYGPTQPGAILNSLGIKFDLYSNAGEGPDSTGLYLNGAQPTKPALDMTSSGVDLHSGHPMLVQVVYDGTTLTMTITDTVTSSSFSAHWTVNIPQTVGSSVAYVGFTASTGGATAIQRVLAWTF